MAFIRTQPDGILTNLDPGLAPVREAEDRKVLEELSYTAVNPLKLPDNYVINQVTSVVTNIIQNNPQVGGSSGEIQLNENGQLIGDSGLTYESTTDTLTTGTLNVTNIKVTGVANLGNVETMVIGGGYPGEVLTTNGAGLVEWSTPYPSIAGKSGKFLVTDGINVNWSNIAYSSFATTSYVNSTIGNLINSAPGALDTLGELANALGNTGDFTVSVVNQLANKADTSSLSTVATSGNYNDLLSRPSIPPAQVQSDWNQGSSGSFAFIKNKPTIPSSLLNLGITDGSDGQVLTTNGAGAFTFSTVSTTGLASRTTASVTTATIANNTQVTANITGYKSYSLLKIATSAACWVRIYTDTASRSADNARVQGTDPLPGSGVIAEVITTNDNTHQGTQTILISPGTIGFNNENPVTANIPITITNLYNVHAAITVTLTLLQLEV